ncbi:MFS transporter [Anaerocolumna xylanovorans]|uniref:Major Facilitator Superfamily protein n=1 Tax=Anaerocolumna xylanovorans DSM 12503 TaxID=1121345 RepID=A0A1M7YB99_9FIRM|nr:MFS transporter [Anaerocolumna xylanovorans]SHO49826.1 Major Facilitator Superfamily protein [Anaerocolumna xylanovorans DSM 12503]
MIQNLKITIKELHIFLILWITQAFSGLGSSMTSFALVIWSYQQKGSALSTSLLAVCSYLPYVLFSIFAGALSDKWNKKAILLVCDSFAAGSSIIVLLLLTSGNLEIWHLYLLNAFNGLMNTVQQPAADVTMSILVPCKHYQKTSGMRSFSNSLVTLLAPVLATAILALTSMEAVIIFDLFTFFVAFATLLIFVKIPAISDNGGSEKETLIQSAKGGLKYLKDNRGILDLMLFLAAINFIASIYNAALPAMLLSRKGGGENVLGIVNACTGLATLAGSILMTFMPAPKNRVRVIFNSLLFSMSTENFMLAFGKNGAVWCLGAIAGWLFIPVMGANMDVIFRMKIPAHIQGRVYAARNTLQFFTIPLGYLSGGILVDRVFEPFMKMQPDNSFWITLFNSGKGSGAAMLFMIIGFAGMIVCLIFRRNKNIWQLEKTDKQQE